MTKRFSRTEILLGEETVLKLSRARILIVGIGGVGGNATEMLCRAGIGNITIVDGDCVEESNLNRQIISLNSNIGESKVTAFAKRLKDINPDLNIEPIYRYLKEEDIPAFLENSEYDFIVDAIDSVGPKCCLIKEAFNRKIPIISSMGAGARIDASKVHIDRLSHTHHDGLSKAVRRGLNDKIISNRLEVVFSDEAPMTNNQECATDVKKKPIGTISYIPAVFGCYLSQYVINRLISEK